MPTEVASHWFELCWELLLGWERGKCFIIKSEALGHNIVKKRCQLGTGHEFRDWKPWPRATQVRYRRESITIAYDSELHEWYFRNADRVCRQEQDKSELNPSKVRLRAQGWVEVDGWGLWRRWKRRRRSYSTYYAYRLSSATIEKTKQDAVIK